MDYHSFNFVGTLYVKNGRAVCSGCQAPLDAEALVVGRSERRQVHELPPLPLLPPLFSAAPSTSHPAMIWPRPASRLAQIGLQGSALAQANYPSTSR
jgi:hypothetical protein